MDRIFWESYRRARRDYHCDYCFRYIQPGQEYYRRVCVFSGSNTFTILREHERCPPLDYICDEVEVHLEETFSVALTVETRLVQVVRLDGTIETKSEPVVVTKIIPDNF